MQTIAQALKKLQRSTFRSRFRLSAKDKAYIAEKGMDVIARHAADFVRTRLAPAVIPNDGKQTPMRGHPVFVAQHACACCCRGCLQKWYRVPGGRELTEDQQVRLVRLLLAWIQAQLDADPQFVREYLQRSDDSPPSDASDSPSNVQPPTRA